MNIHTCWVSCSLQFYEFGKTDDWCYAYTVDEICQPSMIYRLYLFQNLQNTNAKHQDDVDFLFQRHSEFHQPWNGKQEHREIQCKVYCCRCVCSCAQIFTFAFRLPLPPFPIVWNGNALKNTQEYEYNRIESGTASERCADKPKIPGGKDPEVKSKDRELAQGQNDNIERLVDEK